MSEFQDYWRGRAKAIKQTEKAILVEIEGIDEPIWIPQSQIDDRSEVWKEGDEGELWISNWIAEQKELA